MTPSPQPQISPNLGKRSCRQAEDDETVFIRNPWGRDLPAAELWCPLAKLENERSWGKEYAFQLVWKMQDSVKTG